MILIHLRGNRDVLFDMSWPLSKGTILAMYSGAKYGRTIGVLYGVLFSVLCSVLFGALLVHWLMGKSGAYHNANLKGQQLPLIGIMHSIESSA